MHQTPLVVYNICMFSIAECKYKKVYIDLWYLASLLELNGLSVTVPKTEDGRMSLPCALAYICGLVMYPEVDDFHYLVDKVPALYRPQFILCWEAIELEVDHDIVVWSEAAGTDAVVKRLRNLSKTIQLS